MRTRKLDAFPVAYPDPDYLLGPFTMQALCELLYRASAFTAGTASSAYDDTPSEIDLFTRMALVDGDPLGSTLGFYATGSDGSWGFEFTLFESGVDPWTGHDDDGQYYIFDIDGDFYLRGRIAISGPDGAVGNWNVDWGIGAATITVKLECGDFPVSCIGDFSADFEVTGWFPYKTTDGLPAWNTSTGEAINGGPGA